MNVEVLAGNYFKLDLFISLKIFKNMKLVLVLDWEFSAFHFNWYYPMASNAKAEVLDDHGYWFASVYTNWRKVFENQRNIYSSLSLSLSTTFSLSPSPQLFLSLSLYIYIYI